MRSPRPHSWLSTFAWLCLCLCHPVGAEAPEAKLKAAFLYQFAKYAVWDNAPSKDFRIAVTGDADTLAELGSQTEVKLVNQLPVSVGPERDLAESKQGLLAVLGEHTSEAAGLLKKHRGKQYLIVTAFEGALDHGADINLYTEAGKLRFEIRLKNLENRPFHLSSQLLKLARIRE